ncbi:unnamed protein product [Cyprideis torosa]|uniref:Uncharacterized protein n=1 Tax=Cyprideis torosa TaxID=163714 RepID=A0A7R8WEW4_9CRUS|nr:unnamed protein product [Cyprideis torosa]CAG0891208.1 unnamed protein product [Cyprideis torosa]
MLFVEQAGENDNNVMTVPTPRPQCASYCDETSEKFSAYKAGTIYEADFSTVVTNEVIRGETSDWTLSARAVFTVLGSCDAVLKLEDVTVDGVRNQAIAEDLERFSTPFAYVAGRVESLCPDTSEPIWVLNVKRGVLSLIQNGMKDLKENAILSETDVTGVCDASYIVSEGWSSTTVTKKKDLLTCSQRNTHLGALQGVSYTPISKIQNLPIVKSTQICEQEIADGKFESIRCQEQHSLQPFDNQKGGARTTVTTTLKFSNERPASAPQPVMSTRKTNLLFEVDTSAHEKKFDASTLLRNLEYIVESSTDSVKSETPGLFSQFVTSLHDLQISELKEIFDQVQGSRPRQVFLDALSLVGSGPGIAFMRDLIQSKVLQEKDIDSWLTSLAFTSYPTTETIVAVAPLLDEDVPRKQAILGITSLVHKYCQREEACATSEGVQSVARHLEQILGQSCRMTSLETKNAIIAALKGFGNMGIPPKDPEVLLRCWESESNPMEIRLAAIEAFRRFPCDMELTEPLLDTYSDPNVDSELRIASYLTLMRCPSLRIIEAVKETLSSEPVNQVGSFVWTHLTNLQETSDPTKVSVKELLASDFLRNKFNTDVRKFSRNYEGSYFLNSELYDVGAKVESNVIFSTKSYLPRSANLNFTMLLFGEAVNFLEVGGRVEGFEYLVEKFFGPEGYFPEARITEVLSALRSKRHLPDDINEILDDGPQASGYIRIFGNEIVQGEFDALTSVGDYWGNMNPLKALFGGILNGGEVIDWTKNINFLDSKLSIPTIAGLPLELTINGTASVRLLGEGTLHSYSWSSGEVNIKGTMKPSVAVAISGNMIMPVGPHTMNGMVLTARMVSGTEIGGHLQIEGNRLVSANLDTPWKELDIIEVSTDVTLIQNGQWNVQDTSQDVYEDSICTSEDAILGLQLCGMVRYPEQGVLEGSTKIGAYVKKLDTFDSVNFIYRWDEKLEPEGSVHTIGVDFDTSGSRVDRHWSAHMKLDVPGKSAKVNVRSPFNFPGLNFKEFSASGHYEWDDNKKEMQGSISIDKEEIFEVRGYLNSRQNEDSIRWEPMLMMRTKDNNPLVLFSGSVDSKRDRSKFGVDLSLEGLTSTPITLKGSGQETQEMMKLEGSLNTPMVTFDVDGFYKKDNDIHTVKLNSGYSTFGGRQEIVDFIAKYSSSKTGYLSKKSLFFDIRSNQFPDHHLQGSWEHESSPDTLHGQHTENTITLSHNSEKWIFKQLNSAKMDQRGSTKSRMSFGVSCLQRNIDTEIAVTNEVSNEGISFDAKLKTSPTWTATINGKLSSPEGRHSWTGALEYPGQKVEVSGRFENVRVGEYMLDFLTTWSGDKRLKLNGEFKELSNLDRLKQTVNLNLKVLEYAPIAMEASVEAGDSETNINGKMTVDRDTWGFETKMIAKEDKEFRLSVLLQTPREMYSGDGEIHFEGSEMTGKARIDFGHKIESDIRLFRNSIKSSGEMSILWDNRKTSPVEVRTKVEIGEEGGEFLLEYPGRTLTGQLNLGLESASAELQWEAGKKITMTVEHRRQQNFRQKLHLDISVQTPFPNYENQRFLLSYDVSKLPAPITLEFELFGQTQFKAKGRVEKFDLMRGIMKYTTNMEGKFIGDNKMAVDVDITEPRRFGTYPQQIAKIVMTKNQDIVLQYITQLKDVEEFSTEFQIRPNIYGVEFFEVEFGSKWNDFPNEFSWNAGYTYNAKQMYLEVYHKWTKVGTVGNIAIKTPFKNFETVVGNWDLSMQHSPLRGRGFFKVNEKSYSMDLDGKFKEETDDCDLKLVIKGAMDKDIVIELSNVNTASGSRIIFKGDNIMKEPLELNLETIGTEYTKLQVTGFVKMNKSHWNLNANWDYTMQAMKMVTELESDTGRFEMAFIGNEMFYGVPTSGEFTMNAPWTTFYQAEFAYRTPMTLNPYNLLLHLKKNNNELFHYSLNLQQDAEKNTVDLVLRFPETLFRDIRVNTETYWSEKGFKSVWTTSCNGKTADATVLYQLTRLEGLKIEGNLRSDTIPEAKLDIAYHLRKKVIEGEVKFRSNTGSSLNVELRGNGNLPDGFFVFKVAKDSNPEIIDTRLSYNLQFPEVRGDLTFDLMGKRIVESRISSRLDPMKSSSEIYLKTNEHQITLKVDHDIINAEKSASLVAKYNDEVLRIDAKAQIIAKEPRGAVVFHVVTPFEGLDDFQVTAEYDFRGPEMIGKLFAAKDDTKVELSFKGKMIPGYNDLTITFATPWPKPYTLTITSTCDLSPQNWQFTVAALPNDKKYEASLNVIPGSISGDIITPIAGFEEISYSCNYDWSFQRKGFRFESSYPKGRVELAGDLELKSTEGALTFKLSPLHVSWVTSYDFKHPTKTLSSVLTQSGKIYELRCETDMKKAKIVLRTPHEGYKTIILDAEYDKQDSEYSGAILVDVDGKKSNIQGKLLSEGPWKNEIELNGVLSDSDNKGKINSGLKYDLRRAEKSAKAWLILDDVPAFDASTTGKFTPMSSKFQFQSRSFGGDDYDVDAEYDLETPREKRATFSFSTAKGEKKSFGADLKTTANGFSLTLKSPIKKYEEVILNANYELSGDSKMAELELIRGGDIFKAKFDGFLKKDSGDLELLISCQSVDKTLREYTADIEFNHIHPETDYRLKLVKSVAKGGIADSSPVEIEVKGKVTCDFWNGKLTHNVQKTWGSVRSVQVTGDWNLDSPTKQVNVNIENSKGQRGSLAFEASEDSIELNLESPVDGWERFGGKLTIDMKSLKKTLGINLWKNDLTYGFSGSLKADGWKQSFITFKITPGTAASWTGYEELEATGSYTKVGTDGFHVSIEMVLEDERNIIDATKSGLESFRLKLDMPSLFNEDVLGDFGVIILAYTFNENLRTLNAELQSKSANGKLDAKWSDDGKQVSVTDVASVVYDGETMTLEASLKWDFISPNQMIDISVIPKHKGEVLEDEAALTFEWSKTEAGFITSKARLNLLGNEYKENYSWDPEQKQLTYEWAVKKLPGEGGRELYKLRADIGKSGSIQIIMDEADTHSLSWNYDESGIFKVDLHCGSGEDKIEFSGEGRWIMNNPSESGDLGITLQLHSMPKSLRDSDIPEKVELGMNWDYAGEEKVSSMTLDYGNGPISLESMHKRKNKRAGSYRVSLSTPYERFPTTVLSGKWSNKKSYDGNWNIRRGREDIAVFTTSLAKEASNVKLSIQNVLDQPFDLAGSYDIQTADKLGSFRIVANGEKYELISRINVDGTKKLSGLVTFTYPSREMKMDISYDSTQPGKNAKFVLDTGSGKVELRGKLQITDKQGSGTLTLESDFGDIKNVDIIGSFDFNEDINLKGALSWDDSKKIETTVLHQELGNGKCKLSIITTTPWKKWERSELTVEATMDGDNKALDVALLWNDVKLTESIVLHFGETGLHAALKVTTTWERFKLLDILVNLNKKLDHSFEAKFLYEDKKIQLSMGAKEETNAIQGRFEFSTPFEGIKSADLKGTYDIKRPAKEISLRGNFNNEPVDIAFKWSRGSNGLEWSFEMNTPFEPLDDISLSGQSDLLRKKRGTIQMEYNGKHMEATLDGENSVIHIKTPFEGYRNLKVQYLIGNKQFNIEVEMDSAKTFKAMGQYRIDSDVFSVNGTLQTPFELLRNIEVKCFIKPSLEDFQALISGTWAFGKTLSMNLKFRGKEEALLAINTPWEPFTSIEGRLKLETDHRDLFQSLFQPKSGHYYKLSGYFSWSQEDKIRFTTNVDLSEGVNVEADVRTPFRNIPEASLKVTYIFKQHNFVGTAELATPLFPDLKADVQVNYEYLADLREFNEKSYDINASFSLTPKATKVSVQDSFLTNLFGVGPLSISLDSQYSITQGEANLLLALGSENLSLKGTYFFSRGKFNVQGSLESTKFSTSYSIDVNTNFRSNSDFEASLNYKGAKEYSINFSYLASGTKRNLISKINIPYIRDTDISAEMDPNSVSLLLVTPSGMHKVEGRYTTAGKYGFKANLESPFIPKNMAASGSVALEQDRVDFDGDMTYGTMTNSIAGTAVIQGKKITGNMGINIPSRNLYGEFLRFTVDMEQFFETEVSVNLYGTHYMKINIRSPYNGEIFMSSPILPGESIEGDYNLICDSKGNHDFRLKLKFGDEHDITATGKLAATSWRSFKGSIDIKTTFDLFPSMSGEITFSMTDGFLLNTEFITSSPLLPAASLSAKFFYVKDSLNASFNVKTPVQNYENFGLLVNVPKRETTYEPRFTLTTPTRQYALTGTYKKADGKAKVALTIETPWSKYSLASVVTLEQPFMIRIDVTTPFEGFESLKFVGDVDVISITELDIKTHFTRDEKVYGVTGTIKMNPGIYKLRGQVITPEFNHDYGATVRFGMKSRKTFQAEVTYNGKEVGAEFDYQYNSIGDVIAKAAVKTPFEGYEEYKLQFVNQLIGTNYKGAAKGSLGSYNFGVEASASVTLQSVETKLAINMPTFFVQFISEGKIDEDSINGETKFTSSFPRIKNLVANMDLSRRPIDNELVGSIRATLNEKDHIQIDLSTQGNQKRLDIENPWKPVSVVYTYRNDESAMEIKGEVSWDKNNPIDNTAGFGISWISTEGRQELDASVQTPSRLVKVNAEAYKNDKETGTKGSFQWDKEKKTTWNAFLKDNNTPVKFGYEIRAFIGLPDFPIAFGGKVMKDSRLVRLQGDWKRGERYSKFTLDLEDNGSWTATNQILRLNIEHPSFDKPVQVTATYKKGTQGTIFTNVLFETDSEKLLNWETTVERTDNTMTIGMKFEHPKTNTKTQFGIKLENSSTGLHSCKVTVKYMTVGGIEKEFGVACELDIPRKKLTLAAVTGQDSYNKKEYYIRSQYIPRDNGFSFKFVTKVGSANPVTSEVRFISEKTSIIPGVTLSVDQGQGKKLAFHFAVRNKEIIFKIARKIHEQNIDDVLFTLKLNPSKIFSSRLHWRPELFSELKSEFSGRVLTTLTEIRKVIVELKDFYSEEINQRFPAVMDTFEDFFQGLYESYRADINQFVAYWNVVVQWVEDMKQKNAFYINDIMWLTSGVAESISNTYRRFEFQLRRLQADMRRLREAIDEATTSLLSNSLESTSVALTTALNHMQEQWKLVSRDWDKLFNSWTKLGRLLSENSDKYFDMVEQYIQTLWANLSVVYDSIIQQLQDKAIEQVQLAAMNAMEMQSKLLALQAELLSQPWIQALMSLWMDYASWLEDAKILEQIHKVLFHLTEWGDFLYIKWMDFVEEHKETVEAVQNFAQSQWDEFRRLPTVIWSHQFVAKFAERFSMFWNSWSIPERMQQAVSFGISKIRELSQEIVGMAFSDGASILNLFYGHYVWDPANGRIEIDQYLPLKWDSFLEKPELDLEIFTKLTTYSSRFDFQKFYYIFLDTVSSSHTWKDIRSLLPPFNTYAMIAGDQHFVTFDKKFYDFAGECNYVLWDHKETGTQVILRYSAGKSAGKRRALVIKYEDKTVKIAVDEKVTVDDHSVALPWQFKELLVRREGEMVEAYVGSGFIIECLIAWEACTFKMNGWKEGSSGVVANGEGDE